MPTLVVLDDEPAPSRYARLCQGLRTAPCEVIGVRSVTELFDRIRNQAIDVLAVCAGATPDASMIETLRTIKTRCPEQPIIVLVPDGWSSPAVSAIVRAGAFDVLPGSFDRDEFWRIVQRAVRVSQFRNRPVHLHGRHIIHHDSGTQLIGQSAVMQHVFRAIENVAVHNVPILISGEPGTGKELVARAIYQRSQCQPGNLMVVRRDDLSDRRWLSLILDGDLSQDAASTFTRGEQKKGGGGTTWFLDEVADWPSAIQMQFSLFLRSMFPTDEMNSAVPRPMESTGKNDLRQDTNNGSRFASGSHLSAACREDSEKPWIIATTSRNLSEWRTEEPFRRFFFDTANVFSLTLPPLRERMDDIPRLVRLFLTILGRNRPGTPEQQPAVTPDYLWALQQHAWPGNIRELYHVLRYSVETFDRSLLTFDCLPHYVRQRLDSSSESACSGADPASPMSDISGLVHSLLGAGQKGVLRQVFSAVDRILLEETLKYVEGNQGEASERLGISRTTLRSRLKTHGLAVETSIRVRSRQDSKKH